MRRLNFDPFFWVLFVVPGVTTLPFSWGDQSALKGMCLLTARARDLLVLGSVLGLHSLYTGRSPLRMALIP